MPHALYVLLLSGAPKMILVKKLNAADWSSVFRIFIMWRM
jgi:hypothetical protein